MASKQRNGASMPQDGQEARVAERRGLVTDLGPLEVDTPKALGYYGGLGAALALGLIEPPLALFIAAVPLFKVLTRPNSSQTEWTIGELLQGASTPVGGSGSPVIRIHDSGKNGTARGGAQRVFEPVASIWREARQVANQH